MAMIRFHREGRVWIAATFLVGAILALLVWKLDPPLWLSLLFGGLWVAWTALLLNFFRYPRRHCPAEPSIVYAPCDGKVVEVKRTFEPKYFQTEMMQISIFMSPLNVHVNWAPAAGILRFRDYNPGAYLVAWHPKSSLLNEQSFLAIEHDTTRWYAMRQIAGALARRICTYPTIGTPLQSGNEIGFIKFGSRVDVLLPLTAEICVRPGDRVRGALTPIAYW
ncbi:MAG: phosphatidylserine decarboxylase [Bacteroidia bacterium]